MANSLVNLAIVLRAQGKLDEAETIYRELVEREDALALNDLAWSLATSADAKARDGQQAVTFAETAVATTGRTNTMYLETLAAAYAEVGQFTNTIRVQQEAINLLKTEREKKDYETRLKLYQSGSPVRE